MIKNDITNKEYQFLINERLKFNKNDNVLLLQGPIGNFFYEFSRYIDKHDASVYKINFTFAERFFYRRESTNYNGKIDAWPIFFKDFVKNNKINKVFILNDSRPYHQPIINICYEDNIQLYVFEDGYFRPGYITLEPFGVNGNSPYRDNISQSILESNVPKIELKLKSKLTSRLIFSILSNFNFIFSKNYIPYRPTNSLYWSKNYLNYFFVTVRNFFNDKKIVKNITKSKKKVFFVPLQVFDDTQIKFHSKYNNSFEFIYEVLDAIKDYDKRDAILIFKQHPGDRGILNYQKKILQYVKKSKILNEIYFNYTTDADDLIKISDGVILINSTLGINAARMNKPLYFAGRSVYDFLSNDDNSIKDFISMTSLDKKMENISFKKIALRKLKIATQIKGSFYKLK